MAYAVVSDLEDRFDTRELIQLTDRSTPPADVVDTAVAQVALNSAQSEVDGYVGAKYLLPLSVWPVLLTDLTCDVARYKLYKDQAPDAVLKRYEQAIAKLRDIAAGRIKIDAPAGAEPAPRDLVVVTSGPERRFTRDSLRNF